MSKAGHGVVEEHSTGFFILSPQILRYKLAAHILPLNFLQSSKAGPYYTVININIEKLRTIMQSEEESEIVHQALGKPPELERNIHG